MNIGSPGGQHVHLENCCTLRGLNCRLNRGGYPPRLRRIGARRGSCRSHTKLPPTNSKDFPGCQPGRPSRESRFCQEDRHRTLGAVPYDRLVGDLGLGRLVHCPQGGTDSGFRANSSCHLRAPQAQVRRKINKTLVSSSAAVRCQSAPSLDRLLSDTRPSRHSRTSTLIH